MVRLLIMQTDVILENKRLYSKVNKVVTALWEDREPDTTPQTLTILLLWMIQLQPVFKLPQIAAIKSALRDIPGQ